MTHVEMLAAMDVALEILDANDAYPDDIKQLRKARDAVAALTGEISVICHQCDAVLFRADEPLPKVVFP